MVTAGNWGANHSAGHRARDQQREGGGGREESQHMQRSRGEERSIWEEAARRLWQKEEKTEYFFFFFFFFYKEAESTKKRGKQKPGDKEEKVSLLSLLRETQRQKREAETRTRLERLWSGGSGREIVRGAARLINERLRDFFLGRGGRNFSTQQESEEGGGGGGGGEGANDKERLMNERWEQNIWRG